MSDKKRDEKFLCPQEYSVIIPYKDFENFVMLGKKVEYIEKMIDRLDDQYAAIKGMFSECLEKISEINRLL